MSAGNAKPSESDSNWNAAQRLLDIVIAGQKADPGRPAHEVWAQVLGFPKGDYAALFSSLHQLHGLVTEVEAALRAAGPDDVPLDQLLSGLNRFRAAIKTPNLSANWQHQHQQLTEALIENLRFTAYALRYVRPESKISEDELAEFGRKVDELAKEVGSAELDAELKYVLLTCLEAFRRALALYRIRGASTLREAVARCLVELAPIQDRRPHTSAERGVWRKLSMLLWRLDELYVKATRYKAITNAIRAALPEGSPDFTEGIPPTDVTQA